MVLHKYIQIPVIFPCGRNSGNRIKFCGRVSSSHSWHYLVYDSRYNTIFGIIPDNIGVIFQI
jgi:hypothetical protein